MDTPTSFDCAFMTRNPFTVHDYSTHRRCISPICPTRLISASPTAHLSWPSAVCCLLWSISKRRVMCMTQWASPICLYAWFPTCEWGY
eukprot:1138272-Pelagomonas_calceolata.AAC.3